MRREQWSLILRHLGRVIGWSDRGPGGSRVVVTLLGLRG